MKFALIVGLAVACTAMLTQPASAEKTRTQGVPNGQHRVKSGGALNSITGEYREIGGWERNLVKGNRNLRHYVWVPMLESSRHYIRLKPGQVLHRPGQPGKARYIKPVHAALPKKGQKQQQQRVAGRPTGGVYWRPQHVTVTRTNAKVRAPYIDARLASRNVNAKLANKEAMGQLTARNLNAQLNHRKVEAQLASRNANGQLATRNANGMLGNRNAMGMLGNRNAMGHLASREVSGQLVSQTCQPQLVAKQTQAELTYDTYQNMVAQKTVYNSVHKGSVRGTVVPTKAY